MQPESSPHARQPIDLAVRFVVGAIIGCVIALLPLSYVWYFGLDVTTAHLFVIAAFGAIGGILLTVSRGSVIELVSTVFDALPWF